MEETFGTVLIAIAAVAAVLACVSFVGSGKIYRGLGRTGLSLDEPDWRARAAEPASPAHDAEARAEVRQLLEAKSDRREARGEAPLDVEAELERLTRPSPAADDGLRDELRQLVIAGNERRERRGEKPLDVEAEIDRRLRELGS